MMPVSILVFLDDAHRPRCRTQAMDRHSGFQSLFSWMTLIGMRAHELVAMLEWVSILVFLDDAHRPRAASLLRIRHGEVSILVFLDDAHRPSMPASGTITGSCFNPCFLG